MCQILYSRFKSDRELVNNLVDSIFTIEDIMFSKGEEYNIELMLFNYGVSDDYIIYSPSNRDDLINYIHMGGFNSVIMFSRQTPEMESEEVVTQPYLNDSRNSIYFIHGTIYNDRELAKRYGVDISVDTEIFSYINSVDECKGLFSYIQYNINDGTVHFQNRGMGLWSYCNLFNSRETIITTNFNELGRLIPLYSKKSDKKVLMGAFSGGMDISLSIYEQCHRDNYKEIQLHYFDFGTKSKKEELKTIDRYKRLIEQDFHIPVKVTIHSSDYWNSFFHMLNGGSALVEGDDRSSPEENITYVPYRNTLFVINLASIAEQKDLYHVDFIIGLNLSEGMVYLDNNEMWLENIEKTIKSGGRDVEMLSTYSVVAPYFDKTKTNMIKDFINRFGISKLREILDISFSCYYPKDEKPCGECASCQLRDSAISRAGGDI